MPRGAALASRRGVHEVVSALGRAGLFAWSVGCGMPEAPPPPPASTDEAPAPTAPPSLGPAPGAGSPVVTGPFVGSPTAAPARSTREPPALPSPDRPASVATEGAPGSTEAVGLEPRGALGPLPGRGTPTGAPVARVRLLPATLAPEGLLAADARDVLARAIHRRVPELRACLERELGAAPELSGRVEVRFVVAEGGDVSAAELVTSSLGAGGSATNASHARSCEACVLSVVRAWVLPAPSGASLTVTQPIALEAMDPLPPSTGEGPEPAGALGGVGLEGVGAGS